MILVPYRRIIIHSAMPPVQVAERVGATVAPKRPWYRFRRGKFDFEGQIDEKKIKLMPVATVGTRVNIYFPLIRGQIVASGSGSRIQVIQALHPITIVFVLGFFVVPILYALLHQARWFSIPWSIGFIIFHVSWYFAGFVPNAKRSEMRLRELTR